MYTPQQLFGEVGSSSDILSHEPFLERARLQRERAQDGAARLAMGAYLVARLVDRLLTLPLGREVEEGFRWQLDAVRRHVSELPGDAPETAHLSGVVSAIASNAIPTPAVWKNLTAYAYFLEHEGRLEESLEMLSLAVRSQGSRVTLADFAKYALFAGRLNRLLARWHMASNCYAAAEEAGVETGDPVAVLRGRLGRGAVHRGEGNLPAAREIAEAVAAEADKLRLLEPQAIAYGDLGVVYGLQGLRLDALKAYYRAFQLSTDSQQAMRTLGDLGIGLLEIGAYDAARVAFRIVVGSDASVLVRANALLELMDLESSVGDRFGFERCRNGVEAYRTRMSPSMTVDYHYKIGIGLARFGQTERARQSLNLALETAEKHRLNAWYFKVEKILEDLSQVPNRQSSSELSQAPVIAEMEIGLREYAESNA